MKQPKPITIDLRLDALYLHLIWLGIEDYLFTTEFLSFCEQIGHRGVWQTCFDDVINYHHIPVESHRERIFYAFKKFLGSLFKINNREEFIKILKDLLNGYRKRSGEELDLSEIHTDLLTLGYTDTEIYREFEKLM